MDDARRRGPARSGATRRLGRAGSVAAVVAGLSALGLAGAPAALAVAPGAVLASAPTVALLAASPADGASLGTVPTTVTLTFDQDLTRGTLTITGPAGNVGAGTAVVSGASLTEPLVGGLANGSYTVLWEAKAKGTKPTTGQTTFILAVAPGSNPSPSSGGVVPVPTASGKSGSGPVPAPHVSSSPSASATTPPSSSATGHAVRTVDPTAAPGPTSALGTPLSADAPSGASARHAPDQGGAEQAVTSLVSGSRKLGVWLIAFAVLVQAGAALWGLWRQRRSAASGTEDPAPPEPVDDVVPADDLFSPGRHAPPQDLLDRPWTGELPVQADDRVPGGSGAVPPARSPRH